MGMSIFFGILPMIILLGLALFLPALIVAFWRRRPVIAYILAAVLLFSTLVIAPLFFVFLTLVEEGTGDPVIMADRLSYMMARGLIGFVLGLPMLALIQVLARRNYVKLQTKKEIGKNFS